MTELAAHAEERWRALLADRWLLGALGLWVAAGALLALVTTRVADWFVMTDELLYERLGISVAQGGSPLPRVHGTAIGNLNQLYPVLIAPLFGGGDVPGSLQAAHLLNAFVMASAAVPAFLLARRVLASGRWAFLVAVLCVALPWIVLASFLLTEVAAYPAFLWAVWAMARAVEARRWRADLLALVLIGVALLARTQLIVLAAAFPVAVCWKRSSSIAAPGARCGGRGARSSLLYGAGALARARARGRRQGGEPARQLRGDGEGRRHPVAARRGVRPARGDARADDWPSSRSCSARRGCSARSPPGGPEAERAFAAVALPTVVLVLLEAASFDLRFGGGLVKDRYAFYAVPLLVVAALAQCRDTSWPRWTSLRRSSSSSPASRPRRCRSTRS